MIEKQGEVWTCTKCGKSAVDARAKFNLKRHIEVHIEGVAYNCEICGKTSGSKNGLAQHKAKYHRNMVYTTSSSTSVTTSITNLTTSSLTEDELQKNTTLPIVAKRSRPASPTPPPTIKLEQQPQQQQQPEIQFKIQRLQEPQMETKHIVLQPLEQLNGVEPQQHLVQGSQLQGVQFLPAPTMHFTSPTALQFNLPPLPQYNTAQYSAAAAQYTAVLNSNRVQFNFT